MAEAPRFGRTSTTSEMLLGLLGHSAVARIEEAWSQGSPTCRPSVARRTFNDVVRFFRWASEEEPGASAALVFAALKSGDSEQLSPKILAEAFRSCEEAIRRNQPPVFAATLQDTSKVSTADAILRGLRVLASGGLWPRPELGTRILKAGPRDLGGASLGEIGHRANALSEAQACVPACKTNPLLGEIGVQS